MITKSHFCVFGYSLPNLWQSSMSDFEIVIFCWLNTSITSAKKIVSKRWRNTLNILYFLPPGTSLQFVSSNISFTQFVLKVSIFLLQLTIFLFKSINNRILDTHNTFIHFLCVDVMTVFLETFLDIFIALAYTIKFCTNTIFKFCQRWIDISL